MASILITTALAMIQGFMAQSNMMERHFLFNYNSKEMLEDAFCKESKRKLTDNNIHLEEIIVSPDAPIAGKTLAEFDIFRHTGANIVSIERGSHRINIPGKEIMIFPYDKLIAAATDEGLNALMKTLNEINSEKTDAQKSQISISLYEIAKDSAAARKSIKELDVRNKTNCMIVGIDREGISLPKFSIDTILLAGDILWLAGEKDNLEKFEL